MPEPLGARVAATVAARSVHLDLVVPAAQTLAVVGPNGAGKSTLIGLLAGDLQPDEGSVELAGHIVSTPQHHLAPHRRRIATVGQRPLLFPHLSVEDNVAFGPRSRGQTKAKARERARTELDLMGMGSLAMRKPRQLSGGQAQRAAIARALAIDPDIVLLDEPFAALDATVTPELRRLLRARLSGVTTVLVTHDFLDVAALATNMVEISEGQVVGQGNVTDLSRRPATPFMANFLDLNVLHGHVDDDGALHLGDENGPVVTSAGDRIRSGAGRAIFAPGAVSLFAQAPGGSPRNALPATVTVIEDRHPVQRVHLEVAGQQLAADVTAAAVRDLDLHPGASAVVVVKATQLDLVESAS